MSSNAQDGTPVARTITATVNGTTVDIDVDHRTSLLDMLREQLGFFGAKKGCDQGGCGACTVIADGRRIVSCLSLAVQHDGADIVTIEGVDSDLQRKFVHHDGFQCGYCTPGQICSALAMLDEHRAGVPSHVTADVSAEHAPLTRDEIQERMSGNLCRCGAYNGIVAAITDFVATQ